MKAAMIWGAAVFLASVLQASSDHQIDAQVVFLGEVHVNPDHHTRQADWVKDLGPEALVFEMLRPDQAILVTPDLVSQGAEAMGAALGWAESGWPDFEMYYPIFAAAPEARVYGAALPREQARRVMSETAGAVFGPEAARFGVDTPLPEDQQRAREALQMQAHCDALPVQMLPMMVQVQRLRDGKLAQSALLALKTNGGRVVVITGNGHARLDWGAPALLMRAAPGISVFSLGQGETGAAAPDGGFDDLAWSPAVTREDPCAAFAQQPDPSGD